MTKQKKIEEIKRIIGDWGSTDVCELEADHSPCISSTGNKRNISVLAERFSVDDVEVVTYIDETEIGSEFWEYEKLSEEVIDDIYSLIEQYEVDCEKALKRSQD